MGSPAETYTFGADSYRASRASVRWAIALKCQSDSVKGRPSPDGYELGGASGGSVKWLTIDPGQGGPRSFYPTAPQHRADARFFPTPRRCTTFSMYSTASGTLQAVPPMSTS